MRMPRYVLGFFALLLLCYLADVPRLQSRAVCPSTKFTNPQTSKGEPWEGRAGTGPTASSYPVVSLGHRNLTLGQEVGVGWYSSQHGSKSAQGTQVPN